MARFRLWRSVVQETVSRWNAHDAWTQSAALAFYTLFSLAPALILISSVAGAFLRRETFHSRIVREFEQLIGTDAGRAIEAILDRAADSVTGGLAGVFGILTLILGATAVFIQLQSALNVVWEVAPRPGHLIRTLLTKRLLSFALILALGFLLLVSLVLSAAVHSLGDYVVQSLSAPAGLLQVLDTLLSFLLFGLLFALIYRVLPDVEIPWGDVWLGSVVTSLLFCVGKWLIGIYLGHTTIASAYGAAGSVVIIVLWVYYTSLIALLGAEFTRAHSRHFYGSRREASAGARRVHKVEVPGKARRR